jgi:hypothetical protein
MSHFTCAEAAPAVSVMAAAIINVFMSFIARSPHLSRKGQPCASQPRRHD